MDFYYMMVIHFSVTIAAVMCMETKWCRYTAQDNKVFDVPIVTQPAKDLPSCTKSCHLSGNALSLTFNAVTLLCQCYNVDHSNDTGTVSSDTVFSKTYEHVSQTTSTTAVTTTTIQPPTTTASANNPAENIPLSSGITPCKDLLANGYTADGVYTVTSGGISFQVYCNMSSGGWTYVQERFDGSLSFDRTYQEYVDGFGNLGGEHWIGLTNLYAMASTPCVVQFDLLTVNNVWLHARYANFYIGNAASGFLLTVSGHVAEVGLCSNTFMYNSGYVFSTADNDNGNSCGASRGHGWWFGYCTYISINGAYNVQNSEAGFTEHCSVYKNLKASVMKIY